MDSLTLHPTGSTIRVIMLAKSLRPLWLLILLTSVHLSAAESSHRPVNWKVLPKPFHTPSASKRPKLVPRPQGARLNLPEGFQVKEIASGFKLPRFMVLGPQEEALLSDTGDRSSPTGSIYVLKNGKQTRILEGLDRPYGLAFYRDYLYVAEPTSIKRYQYQNMTITGSGEEVIPLKDCGKGHWTRTLLFDRRQEMLYVTVGSVSNIEPGGPPMRAAINRFRPDGSGHEIFASGLRNTVGLRWRPGTDELWGAVQERDGLGDDLVDDYLIHVRKGGSYGWPYAYTGPHKEPRHEGDNQEWIQKSLYPDVLLGAHVAVMDILFYTGDQFPERYRGGLFLAFHGSSNRSRRVGYEIAFIPFESGRPSSGPQNFLTGWMMGPDSPEVWGRPVGLLQLANGSLLVSDDGAGKIWHVWYGADDSP